jgi:hypothetical protein
MSALTGAQQRRVREVLMDRFDPASLKRFVREALSKDLNHFARDGDLGVMSDDLLDTAGQEGWTDDLLTALAGELTGRPDLAADIDAIRQLRGTSGPYVPVDHYETCFVGRRAFVDRTTLRSHLRDLAPSDGHRVLAISGPPICGKSFSRYLIAYLSQATRCFSPAVVDFRDWAPMPPTPVAFMQSIAMAMALDDDIPVDRYSSDAAEVLWLRKWLASKLTARPDDEWCLVIDSIDTVDANERSVKLAIELAHAAERLDLPRVRVVLIGYSGALPLDLAQFMLREEVAPLGESELILFFRSIATHLGVTDRDALIDPAVQKLMVDLPTDDTALFELQSRVRSTATALFGPGPWR